MPRVFAALIVAAAVLPRAASPQPVQAVADPVEDAVRPDSTSAAARAWLELGVGGGWVRLEDSGSNQRGSFALDLGGGVWLWSRVGLGVRLGGWTLEGFNFWDPERGESLSEAFAVLGIRPHNRWPIVARLEGGWASYTANDPAAAIREGDGLGARVALTWDARVSSGWFVSPALVASWGNINPDSRLEGSFGYRGIGALLEFGRLW